MISNYSLAVSNIVCIDLLNSSWEDIHNYCLISNSANGLKMYLKHLHTSLHNDLFNETNPHLVYIENDYIIGTKRHQTDVTRFMLGGLEILPDSNVDKLDKSVFLFLEQELTSKKKIEFSSNMYQLFNSHFSKLLKVKYNTVFIDAHIEVTSKLRLTYKELCSKYYLSIDFLNCQNPPQTSVLVMHKVYFKKQLPIIFVFKDFNGLEYMGWNKQFLLEMQQIKPVDLSFIDRKETLDAILDKINISGLASLNSDELSFLDSFSNS
jgi:hypothetical protein